MTVKKTTCYIVRERYYETDDEIYFQISGNMVEASEENDVTLPYELSWELERFVYPDCPDCGGRILWAEAGGVPGTRRCEKCDSVFSDSQYGCAYRTRGY